MQTGKIKWFNAVKGYGFIEPDNKSKDVFLHVSDLAKTGLTDITPGQKVSFEVEDVKGKVAAVDIKLI
jgi:CspA family cold shock protein